MNNFNPMKELFANVEVLPENLISLTSENYNNAIQTSQSVDPPHQWQTYLNQLGASAFIQWVQEWMPGLRISSIPTSHSHFSSTLALDESCYLQLGDFRCCLLVTERIIAQKISVAKEVLDIQPLPAHFYIVIEVWEIEQKARIRGYLRYEKFKKAIYQSSSNGSFLHFSLDLLEESSLSLFSDFVLRPAVTFGLPEYEAIEQPHILPTINVALWLQNKIDDLSQNLGWSIAAPLTPIYSTGWRSTQVFDGAISSLVSRGMSIPENARASCHNFIIKGIPLQFFAAAWTFDASEEWALLVMIGTVTDDELPLGLQLKISDKNNTLSEQRLENYESYLFSQVIGNSKDHFDVTISLDHQDTKIIPFVYIQDE